MDDKTNVTRLVARTVWSLGKATIDDVERATAGKLTRRQITKGLCNAKDRGLIVIVDKRASSTRGGVKGVYARPESVPRRAQHMLPVPRPIAFAFDLATPAEIVPEWPLPFANGREVNCLGAWE